MAAEKPVRLSVQAMKISSTLRFLRPFRTVAQYLALSFSPTHTQYVFPAIQADTYSDVHRLLHHLSLAPDR